MPQFIMEGSLEPDFQALDAFTQGYIEAMFWTETAADSFTIGNWNSDATQEAIREGQSDGNLPSDAGFNDLHPEALAAIIADCDRFKLHAQHTLAAAYAMQIPTRHGPEDYTESQAGHDFWLTRNGHGCGFWDRGLDQVGDDLSELARPYGEVDVCFADHVEHGSAPYVYHQ